MHAAKRVSKASYYYQTNLDFVDKVKNFYESGGSNSSFKVISNTYTDLNCSCNELWRFSCSLFKNDHWTCACSSSCKDWIVFSLAAQKLRKMMNK